MKEVTVRKDSDARHVANKEGAVRQGCLQLYAKVWWGIVPMIASDDDRIFKHYINTTKGCIAYTQNLPPLRSRAPPALGRRSLLPLSSGL